MKISITIPVYNEAESLLKLYEWIIPVLKKLENPWEIIFINDGSFDGSREILDDLAKKNALVKVIHFRRNFGQTAAFMAAIEHASGDVIIPMDADLQNDPRDIPHLLGKLQEGYDVVSGWRKFRKDYPIRRVLLSRIANKLISKVSGVTLHDFGCTLKAYRREMIQDVRLYGEMHRFIPIYASWLGARVSEIPVNHHPRRYGHSKYGLERVFKVILDLIVVRFFQRYAQKPMYVFGGFGLISFMISGVSALWAVGLKVFGGLSFITTPLPLLFVMSFITGAMCILMGLLAEINIRTYYESQNKTTYMIDSTRNIKSQESKSCVG